MKLTLFVVGKTKAMYWQSPEREYLERLRFFTELEYKIIKPGTGSGSRSEEQVREFEGEEIITRLSHSSFVIAFDERGTPYTSEQFAQVVGKARIQGGDTMTCIIGGAYGLSPTVCERADAVISLSAMTFTHEQARVVAWEQLYRALMILQNKPYHN